MSGEVVSGVRGVVCARAGRVLAVSTKEHGMAIHLHYGTTDIELVDDTSVDELRNEIYNATVRKERWLSITDRKGHRHTIWVSDAVPIRITETPPSGMPRRVSGGSRSRIASMGF